MATEDSLPFLQQMMSSSSGQLIQVGDERNSIEGLDKIDVEKMHHKDGNGYIILERGDIFKERSSFKETFVSLRQYLSACRTYVYSTLLLLFAAGILTLTLIGVLRDPNTTFTTGRLPGFEYTSSGELLSCGSSFEEAEAAGCIFDIMTFAWTPPACYDTEVATDVVSEFSELAPTRGAGVWPWWRWANLTEPLEQTTEVLSKYDDIWTDTHYHRAHCLYLWRIMHRATARRMDGKREVYVYSKATEWEHVIHCNKLLNMLDKPMTDRAMAVRVVGHCVKMS
jgi:hypothetical protein